MSLLILTRYLSVGKVLKYERVSEKILKQINIWHGKGESKQE
jgi:hypothetical protein